MKKLTKVIVRIVLFCAIGLPAFSQAAQGDMMDMGDQAKGKAMISMQTMEVKKMAPIDARQPDVIATASFGLG
jgi:hypothetical protein